MAETFLSLTGWKVRGVTRDPESESAKGLASKGVEIVNGDLDDQTSLVAAFEEATAIFANTDFFRPLIAALQSPEIAKDKGPRKYAFEVEVRHGLNIAEAAASPSTLKTLTHLIYSSLPEVSKSSQGKYTGVFHNDCKAEVLRLTQERFPEVAARTSTVHLGHYVTNWHTFRPAAPKKQADGSFVIERTFSPELKIPFVVARKDSGAFVRALVELAPGINLLGESQELTWPEFAQVWGKALGFKATYKQVSEDEHFAGVPQPLREELIETFRFVDEFGYTGGDTSIKTAGQVCPEYMPQSPRLDHLAAWDHDACHIDRRLCQKRGLVVRFMIPAGGPLLK